MFLIESAWSNIVFNKKRNIFSVLLIAIASASILLFHGYVEYCKEGLKITFVDKSGNLQVAAHSADSPDENGKLLTADDMEKLNSFFTSAKEISKTDAVLEFNGIIGTQKSSTIFWGASYDKPETVGVSAGEPVFSGENRVVLGETLYKKLKLDEENSEKFVTLMTTSVTNDVAAASFSVSGYLSTGNLQADSGLVIASRRTILDLFGEEDAASYIRIFLKNDKDEALVRAKLQSFFEENRLDFHVRDWKEINPEWKQINTMNEIQFSVVSFILCVLIFVSLTQSLQTLFMERIGEFGTMEAVGLKKSSILCILVFEVCIISFIGIVSGIFLSKLGSFTAQSLHIEWTPPGYTKPYALSFFIRPSSLLQTQFFIFTSCVFSLIYPLYVVKKHSSFRLMRYVS